MMSKQNLPEHFPRLRLPGMKLQASRWAAKFGKVPITGIVLYNYASRYAEHFVSLGLGSIPTKYAVVFEHPVLRKEEEAPVADLLSATEHSSTAERPRFRALIDQSFSTMVYRGVPRGDSEVEWCFFVKAPGQELPNSIRTNEPHWVLLKRLRPSQVHQRAVREAAKQVWAERPHLTIPQLAGTPEIRAACQGKVYSDKTYRRWTKDLMPNRRPGRRPLLP